MSRTYRFYVSGGIGQHLFQTIVEQIPLMLNSSSSYPFGIDPVWGITFNDPDYMIDKVLELRNIVRGPDEGYFDVVFAGRPAGATEVNDDQWFDILWFNIVETIKDNTVQAENITN